MKVSVNWDMTGSVNTRLLPGKIQVTVSGEAPFVSRTDLFDASPGVFDDLPPGAYTVSVQEMSADEIAIGSPVTATFTVPVPPAVATPGNVTVVVG